MTAEERAQAYYNRACVRRESLGKDMIRSPGPARTQRIFVEEIADAIRAAVAEEREACAMVAESDECEQCSAIIAAAIRARGEG